MQQNKKTYFVTGIDTEVGKTLVAAILTELLEADYWKPIQSGDLDQSDTMKVQSWTSNSKSIFHAESYRLNTPMSPHASADIDGVKIDIEQIVMPDTKNHLIVEGAGGLLVPLNDKETVLDIIQSLGIEVILVSRHYLGSINHTLLSIEQLKYRGIPIKGIIFNGNEHPTTEAIIQKMTDVPILFRLPILKNVDKNSIREIADLWQEENLI